MKGGRVAVFALSLAASAWAMGMTETPLLVDWSFRRGESKGAEAASFDDSAWETVRIPHDWAISGPFDKEIDKQMVAITQNGEKVPTEKTGRSGALPWIGEGWYRRRFTIPQGCGYAALVFEGAMNEPRVYVDGKKVGEWAYGYNVFIVEVPHEAGVHELAVHLNNVAESSRWYPGAGLYRRVLLVTGGESGIDYWGTHFRTLSLANDGKSARVRIETKLRNAPDGCRVRHELSVLQSHQGRIPARDSTAKGEATVSGGDAALELELPNPHLWSPESPNLYRLTTELVKDGKTLDSRCDTVGIRTISYDSDGFKLNGVKRKFKGVCLHHDLGPLGAAFNASAFERQIGLLKEIGCDSIRTAHNMPSPEQIEICDRMGMMVMAESFDMWRYPKCKNGYARFFDAWHERDLVNLVLANRSHPSVVMYSIGNEIPEQTSAEGLKLSRSMQEIIHRLDPEKPCVQGLDRANWAVKSGVAQAMDIVGLNYRLQFYDMAQKAAAKGIVLGSETASTVSSRGEYKFPVVARKLGNEPPYADGQCQGYDTESCSWSNLPDDDWATQDDKPWTIGEFVWTGFDYLGEPSPYDNYWPSRSSYFGMFDLAGLPKDRVYLYRSRWNKASHTLHLVPHWTWPGREGQVTPVYCYTDFPKAELFVNGVSQGVREKDRTSRLDRYRLRWNDVVYQPGAVKVVAYDADGKKAMEESVRTAGKPAALMLETDAAPLAAPDEKSEPRLAFVTVRLVDGKGTICPWANDEVRVEVEGAARFKAICNGDATSLESFVEPHMKLFHGELVVVAEPVCMGPAVIKVSCGDIYSEVKLHVR